MYALNKESLEEKFRVKEGYLTSLIRHEESEGIHREARDGVCGGKEREKERNL